MREIIIDGSPKYTSNRVISQYVNPFELEEEEFSSYSFVNQGLTDVIINNALVIKPGRAFTFANEPYVIEKTKFRVSFGGIGAGLCVVIKTNYLKV